MTLLSGADQMSKASSVHKALAGPLDIPPELHLHFSWRIKASPPG